MDPSRLFLVQILFSLIMVAFCISQVISNDDAATRSVYLPILTSIIGVWLPSPASSPHNPYPVAVS